MAWSRGEDWDGGNAGHRLSVRNMGGRATRAAIYREVDRKRRRADLEQHRLFAAGVGRNGRETAGEGEKLVEIPGQYMKGYGLDWWRAQIRALPALPEPMDPRVPARRPEDDFRFNPALLSRRDRRRMHGHRGPLVGERYPELHLAGATP